MNDEEQNIAIEGVLKLYTASIASDIRKENERLKKQNNDLRKIYRDTYNRLFKNGNDELARYFQAQIDDCPTFYIEPIIDYAKEWKDYKSRIDKAIEYIEKQEDYFYNYPLICRENVLNILKGDSDE